MSLRILSVEDSLVDRELVAAVLQFEGFTCEIVYAITEEELRGALERGAFDLILSDFTLPSFSGAQALVVARAMRPEIPFIFVSGTIGERRAIEAIKGGATDYVLKDNLDRLGPAVRRALHEAQESSERLRAEEELRTSEERFRQVVENIREVFWLVDPERKAMLYISPAYQKIWGRTCESLYQSPDTWIEAIHGEDRQRVQDAVEKKQIRGDYDEIYRIIRPDGSLRWIHDRAFPIHDRQGKIDRIVGVADDITERKKLEQQFLRAQRLESIGTLAGGIAHDLNNSLGPIITALDLLEMKFTDPESRELLAILSGSARHAADMVRQVLSFARGVEGRRMDVQVRHIVEDIAKIVNDTFPKNIDVRTMVPHNLWTILGDPTQIHQVLLNLCVNARDAMPNGGALTISAENVSLDAHYAGLNLEAKPGPYAVLHVEDSGTGMPPEIADKIFDPFFTTKEVGKGTGLGLSTSLAIVKSHGGFIRVSSELGKGAKFKVYLPAQTETSGAVEAGMAIEMPRGAGQLILVVDDQSSVREITRQTLEAFGYRVITAADGVDALAAYATQAPGIAAVITDMMMPTMDGPATIRVLRKLNPKLPIIAASGLAESGQRLQVSSLNVKHFLAKPYTAEALLKVLRDALTYVG